ncbi:hypothetical protein Dsin_027031 [Dipteronia sinensis]|uniref:Uncharacterized protein n=1 Tax=Dipteronia sinensis TaxID=43782 RepID=A0AAE0DYN7_9ROSI|nr:hypothetical protein Dsin_027031 [Dipteronia sinensis]
MASTSSNEEISHDFPPFFKVYKDGRVERYAGMDDIAKPIATGLDPITRVQSQDVMVSSEAGVKPRIFVPEIHSPDQKLPLLVHYHPKVFLHFL